MKEVFFINDTLENKISYYHLLAFLAMLPFDRFYTLVILISFAIHTIIHLKKEKVHLAAGKTVLVPVLVFLVNLLAIIYSHDKSNGLNELSRQLPILIFPLLFVFTSFNPYKYRKQLFIFFSIICSLTILYLFIVSFRLIISYRLPLRVLFSPEFINHNFSSPIGIHATYLSMYVALCLASCLYFVMQPSSLIHRLAYCAAILILSAGLIELSSKAVLIASCIIIAVFPLLLLEGKLRMKFSLVAAMALAIAISGTLKIDYLRTRFIRDLRLDLSIPLEENYVSDPRLTRWKTAASLIEKSPLIGYGSGSEKRVLKEKYFQQKLYISYILSLDAHNQYISFLIKTGIIGLAVYLFTLFCGFKAALQQRDILFTAFMILITIVSVSENILDVNKGIFFYSFFFSLFYVKPPAAVKQ